jgi:hypothetical protein
MHLFLCISIMYSQTTSFSICHPTLSCTLVNLVTTYKVMFFEDMSVKLCLADEQRVSRMYPSLGFSILFSAAPLEL